MGELKDHPPVLLIVAAISRYEAARQWARQMAVRTWGETALESEAYLFDETRFYERTMGWPLYKQFLAFQQLVDPAQLVEIKRLTNAWEDAYRRQAGLPEPRPLNLDPGYLTEAKLVLATTKDRDHRIYLSGGVYAEVTLYYQAGRWHARPWTYPDYRSDKYHRFFLSCRQYLRRRLHERPE